MEEKNAKAIERINSEIEKIDKKKNKIFFVVIDTKGNPSGSLEYIYKLAKIAHDSGYDVTMLHTEDEFVGVGDWLGEDYASLPHANISKDNVMVSPSDVMFIPEIFSQVMNQTKKLPCKRIAILQNYDYILEQMPFAAQWGDFGIMECITNEKYNEDLLHDIFPYVKTNVIPPYIDKIFGTTSEPKKMIVNVVAKDQSDINRIVKPFYWKYPAFKWVSFRDLRGFPKSTFASALREGAITIWADDDASFGYSALEAIKSGSILIAKLPKEELSWAYEDGKNGKTLRNCCIWFEDFNDLHKKIASVVRSWTLDKVPSILEKEGKKVLNLYSEEKTKDTFSTYLNGVLSNRKKEMEDLIVQVKNNDTNKKA